MELVFIVFFFCSFYGCGLQHRVRLGKYKRDVDSIQREGENLRAIWSPDTKLIAVLVSIELPNEVAIVPVAFGLFSNIFLWSIVPARKSETEWIQLYVCSVVST